MTCPARDSLAAGEVHRAGPAQIGTQSLEEPDPDALAGATRPRTETDMPPAQPYISSLADRTGWTEGQILVSCGAALGAVCVTAFICALRAVDLVFDALPLAERWYAVSAKREDEFAPLKNATGADSPGTVKAALIDRAKRWLTAAGVAVPDGAAVEVGPLFALDAGELRSKLPPGFRVNGPTVLAQ